MSQKNNAILGSSTSNNKGLPSKRYTLKVMGIYTLVYSFVDNVENRGGAVNTDFSIFQSYKVACRVQSVEEREELTGRMKYNL